MGAIFSMLLGTVTGPVFSSLLEAYKAKLASATSADAVAADFATKELLYQQQVAALQTQLITAEQGNPVARLIRPLWALPFVIYTWKLVVWDKILFHTQMTDDLSPHLWETFQIALGAYFIGKSIEKASSFVRR